jgi:pimeloyl-ACP methyl ester carboxylesterase
MTSFVTSLDGTRIAFDRLGEGPTVVVVSGMFCDRQTTRELAEQLAGAATVINYDRRGRGESGITAPYAVEREVEDLGALLDEAGGTGAVYGHSSGAALALIAAAGSLPIGRLVLHEPPYGPDDQESRRTARSLAEKIGVALAEDRRADAIKLFFADSGMPPEMIEGMSADPRMRELAATMHHDFEITGDASAGGTIPEDLVRSIDIPTLVISGGASPEFFRDTAARITEILPNGTHAVLDGQDHGAPADVVAPVVADFLSAVAPGVG